jgi:quinol monooxygenase YgiN
MIIVEGFARIAPGEIDALRDAMRAQIEATRAEPGCIHYSFAQDVLEPDTLRISEIWADQASLEAHFKAPHMTGPNRALNRATISAIKIDAYTATFDRTLIGG